MSPGIAVSVPGEDAAALLERAQRGVERGMDACSNRVAVIAGTPQAA